jgi:limonene-1,2-epoxide hydrolase
MNDENEKKVLRFLRGLHDPVQPDLSEAMEDFADEAVYQSLVPSRAPMLGKAKIKSELEQQFQRYTECDCEILAMVSNDRYVFTERRDHVTMKDWNKRIFSSVNAVFEFSDAGRIISWREYWDTGDIAVQLGLSPEQMQALHAPEQVA